MSTLSHSSLEETRFCNPFSSYKSRFRGGGHVPSPTPETKLLLTPETKLPPTPETKLLHIPETKILPHPKPNYSLHPTPNYSLHPKPNYSLLPKPNYSLLPKPNYSLHPYPETRSARSEKKTLGPEIYRGNRTEQREAGTGRKRRAPGSGRATLGPSH